MDRLLALMFALALPLLGAPGVVSAQTPSPTASDVVAPLPPIVAAFKAAYESGDLEQVKALYTDDGILTTTDDVFKAYWDQQVPAGQWDRDGSEFRRRASIHHGELFITSVIDMGRTVAFDWEWEDFASGVAVLHLRDDRIVVGILAVSEYEIQPRP